MLYQLELKLKDGIKVLYFESEEEAKQYITKCEEAITNYKIDLLENYRKKDND